MVDTALGETIEGLIEILGLLKNANEQVLATLS
jgi:hypothetical protein